MGSEDNGVTLIALEAFDLDLGPAINWQLVQDEAPNTAGTDNRATVIEHG